MAVGDKPVVGGLVPPRPMPTSGDTAVKAPEPGKVYVTAKGDDIKAVVCP